MHEKEQAALDKVIAKACKWADSRMLKAAAIGQDKVRAQTRHRQDEHELAEAIEMHKRLSGR